MTLATIWNELQPYWPLVAAAGMGGMLYLGTKFVRHGRCQEHRNVLGLQVEGTAARHAELKAAIKSLPTAEDLNDLKDSVSELSAQVGILKEAMHGQGKLFERLERQVDIMDTYLREVGAGA